MQDVMMQDALGISVRLAGMPSHRVRTGDRRHVRFCEEREVYLSPELASLPPTYYRELCSKPVRRSTRVKAGSRGGSWLGRGTDAGMFGLPPDVWRANFADQVDVYGGNATTDDFLIAFGFSGGDGCAEAPAFQEVRDSGVAMEIAQ